MDGLITALMDYAEIVFVKFISAVWSSILHCLHELSFYLRQEVLRFVVFVGWSVRSLTFLGPNISKTVGDRGCITIGNGIWRIEWACVR